MHQGAPTVVRSTANGATTGYKPAVLLADHLGTATTAIEQSATQPVTRRAFKPYGENRGTKPPSPPDRRSELRGYSWITVCSPGVALRLGGQDGAVTTGAFSVVAPLPGGGLLLQATDDMRAYGPERVRAVYEALRSVLPDGEALSFITNQDIRLVFQG
ncbi:hypothetical protein ACIP4W_23385 [Streptomyces sp. NPDC088846]|uniref:hypothetical protein n=1 Tax=Streptomyces sp. NPDC088846 TaxID=3365908 RepID=UPI0037FEB1D8